MGRAARAVGNIPVRKAPPRPEEAFPRPLALKSRQATWVSRGGGGGGRGSSRQHCAGTTSHCVVANCDPQATASGWHGLLGHLPSHGSLLLVPKRGVGRAHGDRWA